MLDPASVFRIGCGGIGNARSRVAHSCTVFNDRLFLGVTHPNGEGPEDAARVLSYDFGSGNWSEVHRSPLRDPTERDFAADILRAGGGKRVVSERGVPRERGFRGMCTFKGASDPAPCLYVSTISNLGGLILRSEDGTSFEVVSAPGLGDDRLLSFRALVPFQGRLFTTPIGAVADGKLDRNGTIDPTVFVTDDPAGGVWHRASQPGFGNPDNGVVFQFAVMDDFLYAGTGNPKSGFEIWRTRAEGKPPFEWHKVLDRGAGRFSLNASVSSLVPFNGALYIGTGLPGLGRDRAHDIGPAAAELVRLWPDGTFEVVVGEPRFSASGFQVPLSGMLPGFDDPANSVIWRMAVFHGTLYVATHHWGIYRFLMGTEAVPRGGFHIWASTDGETFTPITQTGFGDPYAVGVRTLVPTSHGLVIGTDDHGVLRERAQRRGVKVDANERGLSVSLAQDPEPFGEPALGPSG